MIVINYQNTNYGPKCLHPGSSAAAEKGRRQRSDDPLRARLAPLAGLLRAREQLPEANAERDGCTVREVIVFH
jgi:hypothetical protein